MNITKEMDKNFWKCIGVILVSIITVFFIKMTNCVCHLTSVMDGHFTVRENMTNPTSTNKTTTEAASQAKQLKSETETTAKAEVSQAKAEAGQAASHAKEEADQATKKAEEEASQAKEEVAKEAGQAETKAKEVAGQEALQAKKLKSEGVEDVNKAKNVFSNIFGGSTSSSNDSSSSTGGTTSLTETSDGGDEKDDKKEQRKERKEEREQEKQNKLTELQNAKDAVIASKLNNIKQRKTSLGNSMNASLTSFDKKSTSVLQESFTCDINSPTKIVAQYANIESLTKDCDKRIDTCSILKVKDKITGGNLYLDSYRQESYASATGWHS